MPKKIYVGLSKLSSSQLAQLANKSGISKDDLARAARGQKDLSSRELDKLAAAMRALNVNEA